jgi:uncharacterized protein YndB with AHSA1/START domain
MRYEHARDISAPPGTVWAVLTDLEHWPDWTASMEQIDRQDSGPLTVGSTALVRQPRGKPMIWTVTELEPERSFTWSANASGIRFTAYHEFSPSGVDGVHAVLTFEMSGPMAWLGALVAGRRIRSYVDMETNGLAGQAEAST